MRRSWLRVISISAICFVCLVLALRLFGQSSPAPARTPVLVELFTSEGCSSCPPADALLMKLEQEQPIPGAEIIVLGEHVDYWDQLGWHDRFSSHQFTTRQNAYGSRFNLESVYTPQMVVDGSIEFVGNDTAKARQAITKAAQTMKVNLQLSTVSAQHGQVSGSVAISGKTANLPKGDLFAALVDPTAETNVRSGENRGHQLHHVGVVRSLVRIGNVQDLANGAVKFTLTTPTDAMPAKERVVVFAQRTGQGSMLSAVTGPVSQGISGQPSVAMR